MNERALKLIDVLKLTPHPEGGYYREIYRSESQLISPDFEFLKENVDAQTTFLEKNPELLNLI